MSGKIDFNRVPKDSPFPHSTYRNYKKLNNSTSIIFTLGEFVSFKREFPFSPQLTFSQKRSFLVQRLP